MSNKKQTAVQWLVDKLMKGEYINSPNQLIEQAINIETVQIMNAWNDGFIQGYDIGKFDDDSDNDAEQYYKETYEN